MATIFDMELNDADDENRNDSIEDESHVLENDVEVSFPRLQI